eukprot:scaffold103789_cov60-Phaeocystis_antarctica.AAC.5
METGRGGYNFEGHTLPGLRRGRGRLALDVRAAPRRSGADRRIPVARIMADRVPATGRVCSASGAELLAMRRSSTFAEVGWGRIRLQATTHGVVRGESHGTTTRAVTTSPRTPRWNRTSRSAAPRPASLLTPPNRCAERGSHADGLVERDRAAEDAPDPAAAGADAGCH